MALVPLARGGTVSRRLAFSGPPVTIPIPMGRCRLPLAFLRGALPGLVVGLALAWPSRAAASDLTWDRLRPLPNSVGVAGPCAGVSNGALIVAGGANFPTAAPWEGGQKVWHDGIFVLETPDSEWRSGFTLPRPMAYAASVTTPQGVVCIGGSDATGHFSRSGCSRGPTAGSRSRRCPGCPGPWQTHQPRSWGRRSTSRAARTGQTPLPPAADSCHSTLNGRKRAGRRSPPGPDPNEPLRPRARRPARSSSSAASASQATPTASRSVGTSATPIATTPPPGGGESRISLTRSRRHRRRRRRSGPRTCCCSAGTTARGPASSLWPHIPASPGPSSRTTPSPTRGRRWARRPPPT